MRCATCYHALHSGVACPSCGCWVEPTGSPHNPWVPDVIIEAQEVVFVDERERCAHGYTHHCHLCVVSGNFRSLAHAIFGLVGLWVLLEHVISPLFFY